jgi:hypothetical protein
MTPEPFAALGARLMLMQRFHLPQQLVVALSDEAAIAVASAALTAADQASGYGDSEGGAR